MGDPWVRDRMDRGVYNNLIWMRACPYGDLASVCIAYRNFGVKRAIAVAEALETATRPGFHALVWCCAPVLRGHRILLEGVLAVVRGDLRSFQTDLGGVHL